MSICLETLSYTLKMSGVLATHNSVSISWKIDSFYNFVAKGEPFKFESPIFSVRYQQFKLSFENYEFDAITVQNLYKFKVSSQQSLEKFQCIIMFQKGDGTYFTDKISVFTFDMYASKSFSKNELLAFNDESNKDGSLNIVCTLFSKLGRNRNENRRKEFIDHYSRDVSSQTRALDAVETLSENFKELLVNGNHTDVKIRVRSREFQAHKLVLATRSPVLNSMFSNDMIENKSGIINITDCDEDAFSHFLTFIYSGKIDQVPSIKVAGLYEIAEKYDLQELKEECVKRLIIEMSVETLCDALRIAVMHEEKVLSEAATNFFICNAENVIDSAKWKIFLEEHFDIGNELFKKYVISSKSNFRQTKLYCLES